MSEQQKTMLREAIEKLDTLSSKRTEYALECQNKLREMDTEIVGVRMQLNMLASVILK